MVMMIKIIVIVVIIIIIIIIIGSKNIFLPLSLHDLFKIKVMPLSVVKSVKFRG
jgi:hypothetical protein